MADHIINPRYFNEAILAFNFSYDWYPLIGYDIDELGRKIAKFDKRIIEGSLQPQTGNINFSKTGNTHNLRYRFYCKSLYRINLGDFIYDSDKKRFLHVDNIQEYDGWGVREVDLTMINLTDYRDFNQYLKYLNGEISV